MRPPEFWAHPPGRPGLAARALSPLAGLWSMGSARRVARAAVYRAPHPVICVGNLNIGGTGKTPVVSDLLQRLSSAGRQAHALSRGYGGSLAGPLRIDLVHHTAAEVGDEPLLLAGFAPAWIARDRAAGAEAAMAAGAEVLVLDDGFQNPDVAKDLSLLVIDAEVGFGNGRVLPAGPLREPVAAGLARADLLITLGPPAAQTALREIWPQIGTLPAIRGHLAPLETGMPWDGLRCLAFAGIGRPEKFFRTLRDLGADVVATRAFPDHAAYAPKILSRLQAEAQAKGAQLVTTEKDAVRLPPQLRGQVLSLPVRLVLDDPAALTARLKAL